MTLHAEDDLDRFVRTRRRLFAIAYRIVRNVDEAEDILQEVWLRWQRADRAAVRNAEAFLATVTTRLAINVIQSAWRRHETSVDAWLLDEVAHGDAGPAAHAERAALREQAARLLRERLPAAERAAFALRVGFGYPYQEIAERLQIRAANARQLVRRARIRIAAFPATGSPLP
ncbi:sigma-70 family RNA polymerase sigma factor [Paractinoplanes rishiriensis]|uniref:sigma-70 family RNA polymerase sigma factor n=1 Tax=Paractinoplanes rishiriensis TaxID=1050105 RepID=UPI0019449300|nr:sigma-70 family RNA polymerase sigma factor [Actinoplanes rishiriensis]